ncbi:MAG: xylulokinase [Planctomycetota bacterium]
MSVLLGIDVGTSGCKAVLMDLSGKVVATATHEVSLSTPQPQWSEQDPEEWWRATMASIRQVLEQANLQAEAVHGVGLTGQMHGAVLLDGKGQVLRPCILWNDQRTAAECQEIGRRVGAEQLLQRTGNPVLPGFTAPKLLWVSKHEPEVFANIASVLLPKDYIRYRLTGERLSDVSDASGTALFDVAQRRWCPEMLEAVGVPRSWLPEVTESPEVSAHITCKESGLAAGTPVVAGAGDQAAQAIGSGIVAEGPISVTIGTSGVVFAASDRYRVEPHGRLHAFCHAVPGKWHLMGVALCAGGSLHWYRESFGGGSYAELMEEAARAPAGSEGLLFLPYLTGERTPHADADARGAFVGLTLRHQRAHLTRAILEGVCYSLRDSLELMLELGLKPRELRASGGGAKSPLWRQILADVCNTPIATLSLSDGAAFGAALLAGVGTGAFPNLAEACQTAVQVTGTHHPGPESRRYQTDYPTFRALYPALRGVR